MRILVYDDDRVKRGTVRDFIDKEFSMHETDIVTSLVDAKSKIRKSKYHMIIADLLTPVSESQEEIKKDSGIIFLQYIFESEGEELNRPDEIVVLTRYIADVDLVQAVKKFPVSVLEYRERSDEWKTDLANRIYDCNRKYENEIDVAIITAVKVEFEAFYCRNIEWKQKKVENDSNLYYITEYENKLGKKLKVLLTMLPMMGMVPAADATHRIINRFHPCCIIMSGICGGNKEDVSVGDIVVAEKAWDYGSGSMKGEMIDGTKERNIRFFPAPEQIFADRMIIQEFKNLAFNDELKFKLRRECDMPEFGQDIEIKIGGMATGAAVIKDEEFVEKFISPSHRKYIGIDMETYGMYYAADHFVNSKIKFVAIKSVSDGADFNKSDQFQRYCARLAANLTNYFIKNATYELIGKID